MSSRVTQTVRNRGTVLSSLVPAFASESRITDQVPDQRIAWESIDGSPNSGIVTFEAAGPSATQVTATINYEPEEFLEQAGVGHSSAKVEGDLQRFRDYIEERGRATGGWRGEIGAHSGDFAGLPTNLGGVPTRRHLSLDATGYLAICELVVHVKQNGG